MTKSIDEPHNARSRRTRDRLLAATRVILERDGFEALTMRAVAERAGVSRRGLYLHFASRGELVNALFGYIAREEGLASSQEPVWTAPDAESAMRQWVRHLARYHPRLMAVDRAIERVRRTDPDAQSHRDTVSAAQRESCRRLAAWLAAEGRLAEPWTVDSATDMLFALICTELFERLMESRGWSGEEVEPALWALHRATFVRPAGESDPPE